jgi:thiamine pyrophosphate-dependent acetolactate synthase large subunit-like protein
LGSSPRERLKTAPRGVPYVRRRVLVVTGDGEMLMGLGALATVGVERPPNLAIVVFDNARYAETGMQPSHTALGVDLAAMAQAAGFAWSATIAEPQSVEALRERLHRREGPGFACVLVRADEPPRVLPPRDGVELKNRFRRQLGLAPM